MVREKTGRQGKKLCDVCLLLRGLCGVFGGGDFCGLLLSEFCGLLLGALFASRFCPFGGGSLPFIFRVVFLFFFGVEWREGDFLLEKGHSHRTLVVQTPAQASRWALPCLWD